MKNYLLSSKPMKIGRHEWRVVVYRGDRTNAADAPRYTDYEWRDPAYTFSGGEIERASRWKEMTTWASYDDNDGCYAGCPHGLRRLYEKYRGSINKALLKGE